MKKTIIAVIILMLIIAAGILEQHYVRTVTSGLIAELDDLIFTIDNGGDAVAKSEELCVFWQTKCDLMEVLVSHNEIREIMVKIGEIQGFVACGDLDNARAVSVTLKEISEYTQHLLQFRVEHIF